MTGQASLPGSNIWELSLYELHRKPHEMVTDNTVIAASPRALHSELMCPICLDLMKNAQTTKECLHRFCQECIITALRSGNKECPTCRKKLVSKRSLRPDPNFDALIAKIYPDREELNAQQEKSLSRSRSTPVQHQQPQQRRKRKATESPPQEVGEEEEVPAPEEKKPRRSPESVQSEEVVGGSARVELQLRPHPNDSGVASQTIRNLSTSPFTTVAHLVKYLSIDPLAVKTEEGRASAIRSLKFEGNKERGTGAKKYTLYIQLGSDHDFTVLPSGTTLEQICETYWTPGDKLKLFFAVDERLSSPMIES